MLFSFPAGTKMFQFPAFAHLYDVVDIWSTGLPHSEISGSTVICTSPELVAACHVLLRLREPRHPPVALFFFFLFYERSYFSGLIQTLKEVSLLELYLLCLPSSPKDCRENAVKSTLL